MRTLLIEYDLADPGQNYSGLIDYIKSFPDWCHQMKSAWLIRTSLSVSDVRDKLKGFLDSNDDVLVMNVTGAGWASWGLPSRITEWLHEQL